jgi:hypothetical protein
MRGENGSDRHIKLAPGFEKKANLFRRFNPSHAYPEFLESKTQF